MPAASPPPALWPPTPMRAASMPSSLGGVVEPPQRGVAVLDAGRERVLGREPVLDRGDHDAELARPAPAQNACSISMEPT